MITIRSIIPSDIDLICSHRHAMFAEAGKDADSLWAMMPAFRIWLADRLEDGQYFGFISEQAGEAVGGCGLMVISWPPHPSHPTEAHRGYVLNVYVDPQQRYQGIAKSLMKAADAEFKRRGICFAILHATKAGRPPYERDGWMQTSEMAKTL